MKKIVLLCLFTTSMALSQINDQTGNKGRGTGNTFLSGKIGIGIPGTGLPQLMLSIGDSDSGIVGGNNTLDFLTNNISRLSIDSAGDLSTSNEITLMGNGMSTSLVGRGINMRNLETINGWDVGLLKLEDNTGSQYWQLGAWGNNQQNYYGYIGSAHNNKAINWTPTNNFVGIGLPETDQPSLMLAIGDSDSGIVGGNNTLDFLTDNISRLSIDSAGDLSTSNNITLMGNGMSTSLVGSGINMRNLETIYGWDVGLLKLEDNTGSQYWQLGAWGNNQENYYGYIGSAHNNKAINWTPTTNFVGIGLPETDQPSIMLAIGDSDTGVVGVDGTLELMTNNVSRLLINNSGNVGVGLTTAEMPSDYKLAVAGKIIGEEVKVQLQTGWPDYVFDDYYNLPTIEEMEIYIKKNGHLQNIPTSEEVEKNGILLGEINSKLLEKIEELSLYTIQQQKEIVKQKEMNKKLEERLSKVENLLMQIEKE